jgi:subtilisin family serine protease
MSNRHWVKGVVRVGLSVSLGLAVAPASLAGGGRSEEALAALDRAAHMPGEVLVQWKAGASEGQKAAARGRVGGEKSEVVAYGRWRAGQDGGGDVELMRIPPGLGIAAAVRGIETDAAVEFAEPNWIYHHTATSNDPYYTNGSLWGMYGNATSPSNAFGSQAAEAWAANKTNCSSVWIGIIDEGYMHGHEDLAANAGVNPGETAGNGRDDDGNGYVDDVYGWDFDGNNASVFDGAGDDHGTHVAGTIGGVGGNGKGVAGVCWSVKLLGAKFLGRRGGTTANAIKAVDYFTDLKLRHGINLVATNNSWGGGGYSQALYDAIERAAAADILFVAAAGNGGQDGVGDNNDTTPHYPSSYENENIIAVASITSSGARSGFSNFGASSVDIGAPGSSITSTLPKSSKGQVISSYGAYSGTSMATPHVSGAVALYAAYNPGSSAAQIKAAILASAVPTASLAGLCTTGGRLDVSGY